MTKDAQKLKDAMLKAIADVREDRKQDKIKTFRMLCFENDQSLDVFEAFIESFPTEKDFEL